MLKIVLKTAEVTVSSATLSRTLLDGASLYGISGFGWGAVCLKSGVYSEGLTTPPASGGETSHTWLG